MVSKSKNFSNKNNFIKLKTINTNSNGEMLNSIMSVKLKVFLAKNEIFINYSK